MSAVSGQSPARDAQELLETRWTYRSVAGVKRVTLAAGQPQEMRGPASGAGRAGVGQMASLWVTVHAVLHKWFGGTGYPKTARTPNATTVTDGLFSWRQVH